MIQIHSKKYPEEEVENGELVLGWPTWDREEQHTEMSVKFCYTDKRGHISRGCPELPIGIAVDCLLFAIEHDQLREYMIDRYGLFNDPKSKVLKKALKELARK
jgi:hypothetical protein